MIEYITYYEWQELLDKVLNSSADEKTVERFIHSYPGEVGAAGGQLIYSQIGKFVAGTLNGAFLMIQNAINESFEEVDIDIAEAAINRLRKKIRICLYYNNISEFPGEYKAQLNDIVLSGVQDFSREFNLYLRRCMEESNDDFLEDLEYVFRRKDMSRFVMKIIGDSQNNIS